MAEKRAGVFIRSGAPLLEIEARKNQSYDEFVKKAANKLKLCDQGGKLFLVKMNGARVLNEPLLVNGKRKPWTLGNYLLMLRKGASKVKLGIACENLEEDRDQVCFQYVHV